MSARPCPRGSGRTARATPSRTKPARSAARYAIGGLIGGILAAVGILFVFSNTVALSLGAHVFWILPLAGLLGGLWAGITSARR